MNVIKPLYYVGMTADGRKMYEFDDPTWQGKVRITEVADTDNIHRIDATNFRHFLTESSMNSYTKHGLCVRELYEDDTYYNARGYVYFELNSLVPCTEDYNFKRCYDASKPVYFAYKTH